MNNLCVVIFHSLVRVDELMSGIRSSPNQLPRGVKRLDMRKYFAVLKFWLLKTLQRSSLMMILGGLGRGIAHTAPTA